MESTSAIVNGIEHADWVVRGWKIKFLLSDKLLHQARMISRADHWYDDPVTMATWLMKMTVCFSSIRQFYDTFGYLPQVGDRLFDEDTGLIILDRSIDGGLKQLTFRLCV